MGNTLHSVTRAFSSSHLLHLTRSSRSLKASPRRTSLVIHALNRLLRPMMCEELKLARLGNTEACCEVSRPIHSAIGTIILSQGYFGMIRPRPASYPLPAKRESGKSLNTFLP